MRVDACKLWNRRTTAAILSIVLYKYIYIHTKKYIYIYINQMYIITKQKVIYIRDANVTSVADCKRHYEHGSGFFFFFF